MLLALVVALVLQTTLARFVAGWPISVDAVLVAVVYMGLTSGPVSGLVAGTVGGLMQDALGSGIIGVGGLAKTVVGFAAGTLGTQFIVTQAVPRFVVFFGATLLQSAVVIGMGMLLGMSPPARPYTAAAAQGLGNGVIGVVLFKLIEGLPGAVERHRARRAWTGTRHLRG
jgi:rod shape-determining protein MreD